jgi:hypothetical protein
MKKIWHDDQEFLMIKAIWQSNKDIVKDFLYNLNRILNMININNIYRKNLVILKFTDKLK